MKKSLIIIAALLALISSVPATYAQPAAPSTPAAPATSAPSSSPSLDQSYATDINKYFKVVQNGDIKNENVANIASQVSSKKEASFSDLFASIAKILTGAAVLLTFIGFFVAGTMLVFAAAHEQIMDKAKTIILYVVVGDVIIAASYAIVKGITMLQPLSP